MEKMNKVKVVQTNGEESDYAVKYPSSYVKAIMDTQNEQIEGCKVEEVYIDDKLVAKQFEGKLHKTPIPNKGELFLIRGLPGSGKTTMAKQLTPHYVEADMFFVKNGEYTFNPSLLPEAHKWCLQRTKDFMTLWGYEKIAVSNTFTEEWEMADYVKAAEDNGYKVHTIVVENRHGSKSEHDVPEATMQAMEDRFDIKLY
jgi:hypothetical protein